MKKRYLAIVFVFIFLLMPLVLAVDFTQVISNSENWQDVYSTLLFANLNKVNGDFLVSTNHGTIILNGYSKSEKIRVITSKDKPYVFNYPGMINSKGFSGADEIITDNANIDLANQMSNIDSFVVIGNSYGFDAIAVAPYAIVSNSWVFIADKSNIYQIDAILGKRNIKKIIIYGYVDPAVRTVLNKYNPEIIYNQDRFKDNIDIVKKYLAVKPSKQVAFTNGEFIEKELMGGAEPVLFTGQDNVPDQISTYLKTSGLEVGVLIGNDLVGTATNIRRTTGISVMVKFARGARTQSNGIAPIEGLDVYPLPTPSMNLLLWTVKYNTAKSQLEVTYKSNSNVPIYFKGTITLNSTSGQQKVGDIDPIFIAPGEYKTNIYTISGLTSSDNLIADVYALYGDNPTSLERVLQNRTSVQTVELIDKCQFSEKDIKGLVYNKQKKELVLSVNNPYDSDCYASAELIDMVIGYLKTTVSSDGSILITAKSTKDIIIKQELTDDEIAKNNFVKLILYSGEKEDSLVYTLVINQLELKINGGAILIYAAAGLVIAIIVIIFIIILIKRRRDNDED